MKTLIGYALIELEQIMEKMEKYCKLKEVLRTICHVKSI
jgi:hypothetical protein